MWFEIYWAQLLPRSDYYYNEVLLRDGNAKEPCQYYLMIRTTGPHRSRRDM